jgi:hypothetical protein
VTPLEKAREEIANSIPKVSRYLDSYVHGIIDGNESAIAIIDRFIAEERTEPEFARPGHDDCTRPDLTECHANNKGKCMNAFLCPSITEPAKPGRDCNTCNFNDFRRACNGCDAGGSMWMQRKPEPEKPELGYVVERMIKEVDYMIEEAKK